MKKNITSILEIKLSILYKEVCVENGTLPTVYEEKRFDGILLQDVFKTLEIHQKKILACLNVKRISKFYDSSQTIETQMK